MFRRRFTDRNRAIAISREVRRMARWVTRRAAGTIGGSFRSPVMTTDTFMRLIVSMMVNAVIFGAGAILVLSVPALNAQAKYLLPVVVVLAFVLAPLTAGLFQRRMRIRNWGRRWWNRGDGLSG